MKHRTGYGGLHSNNPVDCYACWFSEHVEMCEGCEQCVPREWLESFKSESSADGVSK